MSIEPDLRDRVYQMFLLEVPRMLQTIEIELVTLSIDRSVTKVNQLLRAAHSIKGCAASLGLTQIQDLAHQIEDIFRVLNHPELPWNRDLEELLFEIYDCLAQLINAQITDKPLPVGIHTKTQIILADLDDAIGHFVIVGQRLPDAISFGVDLTQSIFEVDVAQSLARLQRVLLDPACYDIAVGEFRAQSEVFTGIAELVTLPGFGSIAHTTIAALDRHPTRAREICCFALVDFYAALEAVLTGDRHSGGTISPGFAFLVAEAPRMLETHSDWAWVVAESQVSAPLAAIPTALTYLKSAPSSDLFDLEDLFDLQLTATDLAIPPFDLIADFLEESCASYSESEIKSISPVSSDSEYWFDCLIEDMLISAAIPDSIAATCADFASFDLVDIFDLPSPLATRLSINQTSPPQLSVCTDRQFELRAMMAQIASSFDRLSPVSQAELVKWQQAPTGNPAEVLAPTTPKLTRRKKSRKIDPTTTAQLTIRVALDRLERMNNCVGELGIERNGLALHGEQTKDTIRELRSKCASFQTIGDRLRQLADSLSIAARYSILDSAKSALSSDLNHQFDDLELDRYGELHRIAQETVEQIAQIEEQIEDHLSPRRFDVGANAPLGRDPQPLPPHYPRSLSQIS
jgi:two-component system, chemotaxis family, sensor histidine kinase and response regulator PixL